MRIYAEDPYNGFGPTAGRVTTWQMPAGPGVRVDAGVEADSDLRPEYDPLLAKIMVHAEDRPSAVARLRRALDETLIGGVQTDLAFLRWLVDDVAFADGEYDTGLIADRWRPGQRLGPEDAALAATAALATRRAIDLSPDRTAVAPGEGSAWGRLARREARRQ